MHDRQPCCACLAPHSRPPRQRPRPWLSRGHDRHLTNPYVTPRHLHLPPQFLPSVTELVVAQCYYLDFDDKGRQRPIYVYLNSTGCINDKGQAIAADNEFYAIWAALGFTRAPLYTGVTWKAQNQAAVLLSAGQKGHRWAQAARASGGLHPPQFGCGHHHGPSLLCHASSGMHCLGCVLKRECGMGVSMHRRRQQLLHACSSSKAKHVCVCLHPLALHGRRYSFPHAKISTAPPVMNRVFGQSVDAQLQVRGRAAGWLGWLGWPRGAYGCPARTCSAGKTHAFTCRALAAYAGGTMRLHAWWAVGPRRLLMRSTATHTASAAART